MEDTPAHGRRLSRAAAHVGLVGLLAVLLWLLYGPGYLGIDAMWSLAWGRELADHGSLTASLTTTPHVLSDWLGAILALAGPGADRALVAIEYVGAAGLVWFTAGVARAIAGLPAALLAGALMIACEQLLYATRAGFLDVLVATGVACAAWFAVRPDPRWLAVGGALAVAALLRPEPWVLLVVLAAWRWRVTRRATPALLALLALVVLVPVLWAASDAILSGDWLYSLHQTRAASDRFRSIEGISGGLAERLLSIPKSLVRVPGPLVFAIGAALAALVWWPPPAGARWRAVWFGADVADPRIARMRGLAAVAALLATVVSLEALIGTLLFARFSLPFAALTIALVAAGLSRISEARLGARALPGFAAAGIALVAAAGPLLVDARRTTDPEQARYAAARQVLRAGVPCTPVHVPGAGLRPYVALWTDTPVRAVIDADDSGIGPRGTYIDATTPAARQLARDAARRPPDLSRLPVPVVREQDGWIIRAGTVGPPANGTCGR